MPLERTSGAFGSFLAHPNTLAWHVTPVGQGCRGLDRITQLRYKVCMMYVMVLESSASVMSKWCHNSYLLHHIVHTLAGF